MSVYHFVVVVYVCMYVYARIIFLSLIDVLFCFSQAGPSHPSNRVRLLVRSIPTCCWDG